MKMNLQTWSELVKQVSSKWLAKSSKVLRRIDPAAPGWIDLNTYDEPILQQGRFGFVRSPGCL